MTPAATTSATCAATTKAGSRCKRRRAAGSAYCTQHAAAAEAASSSNGTSTNGTVRSSSGARTTKRSTADAPRTSRTSDADGGNPLAGLRQLISDNVAAGYGGIDEDAYADVLADLSESAGSAGQEVRSFLAELQAGLSSIGDAADWVGEFLVEHGFLTPTQVEEFVRDCASAAAGIATALAGRATVEFSEDDFGFDEHFTTALAPLFGLLYRWYWRVESTGLEHVPAEGPGLLVSNHAGAGIPFDGAMIKYGIWQDERIRRHSRMLVLDWAMSFPYIGEFMQRSGQVLACNENATALLERGHLVGVFPEGVRGMAKPYSQRYQLQRFGRGGFVRIALETGAPIVPVAVVGSEEIYPKLANVPFVHKLVGAPFVPLTPTFPLLGLLGLIPLPSKWHIEYCEPIDVSRYAATAVDDRALVLEISDRVRNTIQETLKRNLNRRQTPFW